MKNLKKDLDFHPYKIQLTQQLQGNDHERRREWCTKVLQFNNNNPQFFKNLLMSDEAHFDISGYVKKQNSRFWGSENPRGMHEQPFHPLRATVWCAIWSGGIIGPFFSKMQIKIRLLSIVNDIVRCCKKFLARN